MRVRRWGVDGQCSGELKMIVELRSVDSVKPYPGNPRHNEGAVEAVANSIKEFGFRVPLVVDTEGVVVTGHTRLKAALRLGLTEVPVHVAHGLTPAQAKAYRLADNQTASIASWDLELLPIEIGELKALDYDLSLLGWTPEDLAEVMAPKVNEGLVDPDDVPAPPDKATTKRGDLWTLGNHRLLCGDSSSVEDVDRLLAGQPIHLVNSEAITSASEVAPNSRSTMSIALSMRWCSGQSLTWAGLPSGQRRMRFIGSTALTTSSIEICSDDLASENPPLGPRCERISPATTRSRRTLERYPCGTFVCLAIVSLLALAPGARLARWTMARSEYSMVWEITVASRLLDQVTHNRG